jgi:hypothetical protein
MSSIRPPKSGFGLYYDPVYGYIPLSPIIRRALDLPSMQRLRHIKQLSTLFLFFPGATHSRFEHSVGVCYLADKVFERLSTEKYSSPRKPEWPELTPVHRTALLLGALFHDVGHGTWSHVSEIFCDMKEDYLKMKHKGLSKNLIEGNFGDHKDIKDFINEESKRMEIEWKSRSEKSQWKKIDKFMTIMTPENIANIATGGSPPNNKEYTFLSNIVSGVFDVDRLDYLRRDAYHSGYQIGNIDIWEIIHSYILAKNGNVWTASLLPSAANSVEILLTVRDLTYRQFYYSRSHRVAQEMLIRGMVSISKVYSKEQLIIMDDEKLLSVFRNTENGKGNAFTNDISERIRIRNIYEPLPFVIHVSKDLDESAKQRWFETVIEGPKRYDLVNKWLKSESRVSEIIKLPEENQVIFDIRAVPIVTTDEYESKIFYNEKLGESYSLLDLAPQLKLIKGIRKTAINGKEKEDDLTKNYIEEISQLLILLPYRYIYDMATNCKMEIDQGKSKDAVYIEQVKKLYPVRDAFINLLGIKKRITKDKIKEKFYNDMTQYLDELIQIIT